MGAFVHFFVRQRQHAVTPSYSFGVMFNDFHQPGSMFRGGMNWQLRGMRVWSLASWESFAEGGSCPSIFLCRKELFCFHSSSVFFYHRSTRAYQSQLCLFLHFNYQFQFHLISLAGDLHQYRLLTRFPVPTKERCPPRRENSTRAQIKYPNADSGRSPSIIVLIINHQQVKSSTTQYQKKIRKMFLLQENLKAKQMWEKEY